MHEAAQDQPPKVHLWVQRPVERLLLWVLPPLCVHARDASHKGHQGRLILETAHLLRCADARVQPCGLHVLEEHAEAWPEPPWRMHGQVARRADEPALLDGKVVVEVRLPCIDGCVRKPLAGTRLQMGRGHRRPLGGAH